MAESVLGTFMMCSTQLGSNQAFSQSFHQCLSHTTVFSRVNPAFPSDNSDNTFHFLQPLLVPHIFQWRVVASALFASNSLQVPESTSSSKDSLLLLSTSYVSGTCFSGLIFILLFPLCPDFFQATLLVQRVRRPFRKFSVCIRRFLLRFVLLRYLRCHHRRHHLQMFNMFFFCCLTQQSAPPTAPSLSTAADASILLAASNPFHHRLRTGSCQK